LVQIKQVLVDATFRKQLLTQCSNHDLLTFWQITVPNSSEQQRSSLNALLRRFDKLLLADLTRLLFNPVQSTFRFAEAISQQLIVLCPIPHVKYGSLAATAAMVFFQQFLRAAFERPGHATSRNDYPLIVDEFQVLAEHGATQDIATALTQLRSLGIPTIYAHQSLAQIGELRDLLLINAENRVLLRTQEPDATSYARQYAAAGLSAIDLANQNPSEHQYARFVVGGQIVGPFSMVPLGWPAQPPVVEDQGAPTPGSHGSPGSRTSVRPPHTPPLATWQQIIPVDLLDSAASPAEYRVAQHYRSYDRQLIHLIYTLPYNADRAKQLAETLDTAEWQILLSRWQAVARAQRQYLVAHPDCIPDKAQWLQWLSRLGFARPRILAEAELWRMKTYNRER
jgi:hypothetical protein